MASVAVNGIRIEYEDSGVGEPLLLVMGMAGQLIDWPPSLVDGLIDAGFRVIRHDNRDAGLSSETDGDPPLGSVRDALRLFALRRGDVAYRLDDMANDAVGLLDALGIESAHVVGVSMGGMIAQTMAIEHSRRVRSLVSVMSNTGDRRHGRPTARVLWKLRAFRDVDVERAAEANAAMFALFAGSSWDRRRHLIHAREAVARSYRPRGTAHQMAAVAASPDRTPSLGHLTAPTLVIHGLQDKLVKPSGGVATAEAVPGSRLLFFPDMGHDLPERRSPEIVSAIAENANRRALTPVPH